MRWRDFISKELGIPEKELPNGYQKIGETIVLNLNKGLWKQKKEIGMRTLEFLPKFKTVFLSRERICDEFRVPNLEKIAGNGSTTVHRENGCLFKIDLGKVMFSKGNINERKRMGKIAKGEVLDMFAGIGYFSVPAGKNPNVRKIVSIEKNPCAFRLLEENFLLNKINGQAYLGDNREIIKKHKLKADEIIMGFLPSPSHCFKSALSAIREKGIIHYHMRQDIGKKNSELIQLRDIAKKEGFHLRLKKTVTVKKYAPKVDHIVLDLAVKKASS